MPRPKSTSPTNPTPKSRALEPQVAPGRSEDKVVADAVVGGLACNVVTLLDYSQRTFGELSLSDCVRALQETNAAVKRGDLTIAETMLTAQSIVLNSIFAEMARRASLNMGENLDAAERYLRLAMKAQGQCRATLETLAEIKNPPVVFAKQANINNGGQQQVVNGNHAPGGGSPAPARETQPEQSKLLEASHGERLDFGAQGSAVGTHQDLAPVGAVNRADERRR